MIPFEQRIDELDTALARPLDEVLAASAAERPFRFSRDDIRSAGSSLGIRHRGWMSDLLERADHACDHAFILAGNDPAGSYLSCGAEIDWHVSPNGDREGLFTLNRHRWFFDLARAWFLTNEQRYIDSLTEQLGHWIISCPAPRDGKEHFHDFSPWKVLNAAIRVSDFWLPSYHLIRSSESVNRETRILFLHSILEHANILSEHTFDTTHNHTIKEMGGLLSLSLYFPEFRSAKAWCDRAMEKLEECMQRQVFSDGVHIEATPAYHKIAMEWFLLPCIDARRAGVEFSSDFEAALGRMARFAVASSFPDGTTTPIGDSDRNALERESNDRDFLLRLVWDVLPAAGVEGAVAADPDVLWLTGSLGEGRNLPANGPREGNCDSERGSAAGSLSSNELPLAYRDGGFFVMSDRAQLTGASLESGEDDSYLIVRNGPMNHGHPHADLLSILLYRHGRLWLTDTGKYTYNESPRRKYLKGTRAHNTAVVDWEDQAPYRDRMSFSSTPDWEHVAWREHERFVFYEGLHRGYERLPKPVSHARQVVWVRERGWLLVDRFSGGGEHLFDLFFHFPVSEGVRLGPAESGIPGSCHLTQGTETLSLHFLAPEEGAVSLHSSWVSPAYGERHDATLARFRVERSAPTTVVSWLSFAHDDVPDLSCGDQQRIEVRFSPHRQLRSLTLVSTPGEISC